MPEYDDSVAMFGCHAGHVLTGHAVLGCVDGVKWNGTVPECKEIVSDQPATGSSPKMFKLFDIIHLLAILLTAIITYRGH